MPYIRAAEEILKGMSEKDLLYTLLSIYNEDYYEQDFQTSIKSIQFLSMLENFDIAFAAETGRVLLTPLGEKLMHLLNSMLFYELDHIR